MTEQEQEQVLSIGFMNIRGQTGLNVTKQVQIEQFLKTYNIDLLNCQEINIDSDSFQDCHFINSLQVCSGKYLCMCIISHRKRS